MQGNSITSCNITNFNRKLNQFKNRNFNNQKTQNFTNKNKHNYVSNELNIQFNDNDTAYQICLI